MLREGGLQGCALHPQRQRQQPKQQQQRQRAIRGMAGWVRLRGPLQVRPCKLGRRIHAAHAPATGPPRLRQFSAICWNDVLPRWVSTLVDTVDPRHAWMTHSISDRCVDQGRHLPTAARNKAAVANSRVNLSKVGRCGWAGPLAPWMAPSSPHGWVHGVSCPPTPPRHPTECRSGSGSGFGRCIEQVQGCKPCRNPPNHDCSHLPARAALAKVEKLT